MHKYKFILSAHPHEYRAHPDGGRVWGTYLGEQRKDGFVIREPSDNWIPYMVASDIVISDFTGLMEYAVVLNKPLLVTVVPDGEIAKGSPIEIARRSARLIADPSQLRDLLSAAAQTISPDEAPREDTSISASASRSEENIRQEVYRILGMSHAR
jgi:hypothetical protein